MIPQNLTVTATGKRSLSVSWEPPLFMGTLVSLLCYKILYAPAHGKNNEVSLIAVHRAALIIVYLLASVLFCSFSVGAI